MCKCIVCGKELNSNELIVCKECVAKSVVRDKCLTTRGVVANKSFVKGDTGKLKWHLMPWKQMEAVQRILNFGAEKYSENNWQKCEDKSRYEDALMRHVISYLKGERKDPESGESHLAHAVCNCLFIMWMDDKNLEELEAYGTFEKR